jgi:hypothetical protein
VAANGLIGMTSNIHEAVRVSVSRKEDGAILLALSLCHPLFHRMGERLALVSDQYGQHLERGRVAGIFRLVHVGGLLGGRRIMERQTV